MRQTFEYLDYNDDDETALCNFLQTHDINDPLRIPTLTKHMNTYFEKDRKHSRQEIRYKHNLSKRNYHDARKGHAATR